MVMPVRSSQFDFNEAAGDAVARELTREEGL
jgi:hypothetical protein